MRKKLMSMALALCMLLTLLPFGSIAQAEGTAKLKSLLNSETTTYAKVDLSIYTKDELKAVKLSDLLPLLTDSAGTPLSLITPSGTKAAWTKYGNTENDNYTVAGMDDTLDLTPPDGTYSNTFTIEMILGNSMQLDSTNNTKYKITATAVNEDLLNNFTLNTKSGSTLTEVSNLQSNSYYNSQNNKLYHYLTMYPRDTSNSTFYSSFDVSPVAGYSAKVYAGQYDTAEAAAAGNQDVTSAAAAPDICTPVAYSDNYFTVVYTKDADNTKTIVRQIDVYVASRSSQLEYDALKNDADANVSASIYYEWNRSEGYSIYKIVLKAGCSASDSYKLTLNYFDAANQRLDKTKVVSAVIDDSSTDIHTDLFGDGYSEVYGGNGHVFTVTDTDGATYKIGIKVVEGTSEGNGVAHDTSVEADTYFQARSAKAAGSDTQISADVMDPANDSLYSESTNCYQTVFLKDTGVDLATIKPVFWVDTPRVTAYAPADGVSTTAATEQKSGESTVNFSKNTVEYTARDGESNASGKVIKNYWVTYVKEQTAATLFVNGPCYDSDKLPEDISTATKREVNLSDTSDYHDVFVANIGDASLTGLTATLDADASKLLTLDTYWNATGDANGTLDTITSRNNKAKIRLRLKSAPTAETGSTISGKLTIASSAGTKVIYLSGTIAPKIVTETTPDAVMYVPYQVMIQTNSHNDSDTITYALASGSLPDGVSLNEKTGEIYGVPMSVGTYSFTVSASNGAGFSSTSKEYTINVLDNTDENVAAETTDVISQRIPETVTKAGDEVFEIEHSFDEFTKVFIDGNELTLNEDYSAEKGSTKITVHKQAFNNQKQGKHTIATEFRSKSNKMTPAAQNYIYKGSSKNNGGGTHYITPINQDGAATTPTPTPTPSTPAVDTGFDDVKPDDWFKDDVTWANDQKYMIGVAPRTFDPNGEISEGMLPTALARLSKADLSTSSSTKYDDIADGQWYSDAAKWARNAGIIDKSGFNAASKVSRGSMAVAIVKYLDYMGVKYEKATENYNFTDASKMSADELSAFQTLYKIGIFKGTGNNEMDPGGSTTRAQFATLMHRLEAYISAGK